MQQLGLFPFIRFKIETMLNVFCKMFHLNCNLECCAQVLVGSVGITIYVSCAKFEGVISKVVLICHLL